MRPKKPAMRSSKYEFEEVERLGNKNRGGYGSTGR